MANKVNNNKQGKKTFYKKDIKRPTRFTSKKDVDKVVEESANDIKWWSNIPSLVKDVANLPYSDMLGLRVPLATNDVHGSPMEQVYPAKTFPGIMKIEVTPTLGVITDATNSVNIAMQAAYAYIRSFNSGSKNYEYTDYAMYLLAAGSLYAYYAELVRLYGVLRTYSITNRYYGKLLCQALGYNYEDLVSNLADFRTMINNFAIKINTFAVPKEFNYFDRMAWLPLNLYTDANHAKAQIYALQYDYLYQFDGTSVQTGSALKPISVSQTGVNQLYDMSDIKSIIDTLVNAMYYNEDIAIMSGDTFKAFGAGNVRSVDLVPVDVAIEPVYNEGVLAQIHHAIPVGKLVVEPDLEDVTPEEASTYGWITQKGNTILSNPRVTGPSDITEENNFKTLVGEYKLILDCGYNDPTPEYNMEATRLMTMVTPDSGATNVCRFAALGTEFVSRILIYKWDNYVNQLYATPLSFGIFNFDTGYNFGNFVYLFYKQYFDWSPICYVCTTSEQSDNDFLPCGEIFNYTVINREKLNDIHSVAVQSLFNTTNLIHFTKMGSK